MASEAPPIALRDTQIEMAHGAGGKASRRLVEGLLRPLLSNPLLDPLADAAILSVQAGRIAFTTDGFVVKPLAFPGGSIGVLAVNGTLNDLAVTGARPLALTAGLVLEEGLRTDILEREVRALARAARDAGVQVVAGDTKVVEHGKADGMYLTTAGIGAIDPRAELGMERVRPGDKVILSGPIGDHGITILLARGELDLEADLRSDTRPVWPLVSAVLGAVGGGLRWLRDPTRGGVASALGELVRDVGVGVALEETEIPVRRAVRGACELLGLDPLHIANEGQFVAVVAAGDADRVLETLRRTQGGEEAAIIGTVTEAHPRTVLARTAYGGTRVIDMLVGDPLPRIC